MFVDVCLLKLWALSHDDRNISSSLSCFIFFSVFSSSLPLLFISANLILILLPLLLPLLIPNIRNLLLPPLPPFLELLLLLLLEISFIIN